MSFLSGIVRAAGALVGGALGGPAGAAIGGGLATKLTGGSTKDALITGAVSGIGAYALPKLGEAVGIGGTGTSSYDPSSMDVPSDSMYAAANAGAQPGMLDRVGDFAKSNPGTLAALGIGGLMAAGAAQQPQQSGGSYVPPPVGSETSVRAKPLSRSRRQYTGDLSRYGETGNEFQYFDRVNPEVEYYARGGRVMGIGRYAEGGRTYVPFGGDYGTYGQGGEHRFFSGAANDTAPPSSPSMASIGGGYDDGMFRYTPSGELATEESSGQGNMDTGKAKAATLGEFARAALSGLSAISGPIGFATALGYANNGQLGTMSDALGHARGAFDNLTENVDRTDPFGYRDSGWSDPSAGIGGGFDPSSMSAAEAAGQQSNDPGNANAETGGVDTGFGGGYGGDNVGGMGFEKAGGPIRKRRGIGYSVPSPAARAARIKGRGTGQSDEIPAMLSDGEHVLDSDFVSLVGDGSNDAGHNRIERWKRSLRSEKRSAPANKIPPKTRGLGSYMPKARAA